MVQQQQSSSTPQAQSQLCGGVINPGWWGRGQRIWSSSCGLLILSGRSVSLAVSSHFSFHSKIQTYRRLKKQKTKQTTTKNGDLTETVQPCFRFLFPMLWILCLNSKLLLCVLQVRWMWALFVVIVAPYFMTFIKCTWRACFKTTRTPTASPFLAVSIYIYISVPLAFVGSSEMSDYKKQMFFRLTVFAYIFSQLFGWLTRWSVCWLVCWTPWKSIKTN